MLAEKHREQRKERASNISDFLGTVQSAEVFSASDFECAQQVGSAIAEQLLLAVVQAQQNPAQADTILNYFAPEAICFLQKNIFTSISFCKALITASNESRMGFETSSLHADGQIQSALPAPSQEASETGSPPDGLAALNSSIAVADSKYTILSTLTGTLVAGAVSSPFCWRNRLVKHKATESWLIIASEFVCGEEMGD